jgi:hypothetical protein
MYPHPPENVRPLGFAAWLPEAGRSAGEEIGRAVYAGIRPPVTFPTIVADPNCPRDTVFFVPQGWQMRQEQYGAVRFSHVENPFLARRKYSEIPEGERKGEICNDGAWRPLRLVGQDS